MSRASNSLRHYILIALAGAACTACAHGGSYDFPNTLGVLPPQKPTPLWLGSVRGTGTARGAASVTPSQTPGWDHVLISINDAPAGGTYAWSLHSGSCSGQGSIVGPSDRYADFITRADGSGDAEAVIPVSLSPSASYSVVATPVTYGSGPSAASTTSAGSACADLTLGSM